jgi:hypothetical protein
MMNEESGRGGRMGISGARGGYSGVSEGFAGSREGFGGGQQFQRRGDQSSHVVYKNSKMNKKDFEKK